MPSTWDCNAGYQLSAVPPQGHYSVYQVELAQLVGDERARTRQAFGIDWFATH
jgi:hypothetical protein